MEFCCAKPNDFSFLSFFKNESSYWVVSMREIASGVAGHFLAFDPFAEFRSRCKSLVAISWNNHAALLKTVFSLFSRLLQKHESPFLLSKFFVILHFFSVFYFCKFYHQFVWSALSQASSVFRHQLWRPKFRHCSSLHCVWFFRHQFALVVLRPKLHLRGFLSFITNPSSIFWSPNQAVPEHLLRCHQQDWSRSFYPSMTTSFCYSHCRWCVFDFDWNA